MDSTLAQNCEKLNIISDLIMKSPPGEVYAVLDEIQDLLQGETFPSECIESVLKEYNLANHTLVTINEEDKPLILVGSIDDTSNVYKDMFSHKAYQFDHLNNRIIKEEEYQENNPLTEELGNFKNVLMQECKKYISTRFTKRSNAFIEMDGYHFDILLVGELLRLSSYYTGRWVSSYSLDIVDTTIQLTGQVTINTHYFENGNVRMDVKKDMQPVSIPLDSVSATTVFDKIAKFEDDLQQALQDVFAPMEGGTLKEFRRRLPRTHHQFQWNVNAHKMADTMRENMKN